MILAEKIMKHRKENGWSQEDLAIKLGVSRQSVSKWESTASIPDLDKIIKLSEIFGVSTDYLLKDDLDEEPGIVKIKDMPNEENEHIRKVSLDEANRYMDAVSNAAKWIGIGVVLCILSPVLLILLASWSEFQMFSLNEDMAAGIGVTILFLMIASAVVLFIMNGMKLSRYEYLEKELIDLEYGVAGIVQNRQENFEGTFRICIVSGVALCICSVIPYFIGVALAASDIFYIYCTALLFVMIAFGVFLFVNAGMIHESFNRLLESGDYTREKKVTNKKNENLSRIYWGLVAAIYLGYSFITMNWNSSWIIWPVAGVLFAVVWAIAGMIRK